VVSAAVSQHALHKRGERLEYATVVWNSLEAVVAVSTGMAAHSIGLVAFGLDSLVEVFASVVVLWYLGGDEGSARARRALRLLAFAFGGIGVYLLAQSVRGFITHIAPDAAPVGTVFMAATVAVMFLLAWGKRTTGRRLRNKPLEANARLTFLDGCLASGVLLALLVDRALGWWWADPLAAAVVAVGALYEARRNYS
jgi:divalent metal cation (Fe/Co/Zn/Cd) transporter